jgi:pimeloyl-ACP methyl ester carboxylesterase
VNRGRLALALAAAAWTIALAEPAGAELRFRDCSDGHCARLRVPLDHSGAVPGSLTLRVFRPFGVRRDSRGLAVLLQGGPGVPSRDAYGWLERLRRQDIVTFEPRGTGAGGRRCRDLEAATMTDAGREAEACASLLGDRRGFFRAADTVEDLELIRAELGAERLTLIGAGYGSYVAQRYALRYPGRVERMIFDGVVDAAGVDPLYLDSVAAVPRVLGELCGRDCRSFTSDPVADTARLVERLAAAPLRGAVVRPTGRRRTATLTRQDVLFTLLGTDENFVARSDYPAAVVSALRGDPAPLLRLKRRTAALLPERFYPRAFSLATYAAATCEETGFPWGRGSSTAERDEAAHRTQSQMDPALVWPFDPGTLVRSDLMRLCRRWPVASPGPPAKPAAMPDVPVLMLASRALLRLPVETARRAAARFPRAHVLVTPAEPWLGGCAERAVGRFMRGRPVQARCARGEPPLRSSSPKPASLGELRPPRRLPGRRGRLVSAVGVTIGDFFDDLYARISTHPEIFIPDEDADFRFRIGGLRGGFVVVGEDVLRMRRYEVVPGVRLSGRLVDEDAPLRIDGPGRLDGVVRVSDIGDDGHMWVRGRVAGRRVRVRVAVPSRLLELFAEDEGGDTSVAASSRLLGGLLP